MARTNPVLRFANTSLDWLSLFTKYLTLGMVAVMTAITFYSVVMRYFFNSPILWGDEYTTYLMVGVSLLGANFVLKENGHIYVDYFINFLSPKAKAWTTAIFDVISIFCLIIILIQVTNVTRDSFELKSKAVSLMRTPLGPVQLMMPVGFGLLLLELLRVTIRSFHTALTLGCTKAEPVLKSATAGETEGWKDGI